MYTYKKVVSTEYYLSFYDLNVLHSLHIDRLYMAFVFRRAKGAWLNI